MYAARNVKSHNGMLELRGHGRCNEVYEVLMYDLVAIEVVSLEEKVFAPQYSKCISRFRQKIWTESGFFNGICFQKEKERS